KLVAQFGAISFFAQYFTTLKANKKAPRLKSAPPIAAPMPSFFPAPPLRFVAQEPYNISFIELSTKLAEPKKAEIERWISRGSTPLPPHDVLQSIITELEGYEPTGLTPAA